MQTITLDSEAFNKLEMPITEVNSIISSLRSDVLNYIMEYADPDDIPMLDEINTIFENERSELNLKANVKFYGEDFLETAGLSKEVA